MNKSNALLIAAQTISLNRFSSDRTNSVFLREILSFFGIGGVGTLSSSVVSDPRSCASSEMGCDFNLLWLFARSTVALTGVLLRCSAWS